MTWVTTGKLAIIVALCVLTPLLILVVRILDAAPTAQREVLALDAVVMGVGTAGMAAFMAVHLRSALRTPLAGVAAQLDAILAGHMDHATIEQGPQEVQAVAQRVNLVAQELERRVQMVAMRSGAIAIGTVLLGVAHEVSNPVAHMRITAELLANEADRRGDAHLGRTAASLRRGLTRLEEVVSTLRQCGGQPGPHPLDQLVRAAVITSHRALLSTDVHVRCDDAMAFCQPDQMIHALAALLQNAGESGARHVWVDAHTEGRYTMITISDDGPGVAEELAAHAADPFITTKPGHAGLGLPLARVELEAQGGSLELQAREPTGTRVTIRLPSAAPEAA